MSAESTIADIGVSATVERQSLSATNTGFMKPSWASHLTGVMVHIQPDDGNEAVRYGGKNDLESFRIYTKYGQDIIATDRIVVGSTTYEIVNVQSLDATNRPKLKHMKILAQITKPNAST